MSCKPTVIVNPTVNEVVVTDDRPTVVKRPTVNKVVQVTTPSKVVKTGPGGIALKTQTQNKVVEVNTPGPKGDQGPPGPAGGTTVLYEAGETIFGLRAVRADGDQVYIPDQTVVEHAKQVIGIALQSVVAGTPVEVQLGGVLEEGSWNWTPGFVYCGTDGQLTQSPPTTGWLLSIGRATGPTTINIDIDTPFVRA